MNSLEKIKRNRYYNNLKELDYVSIQMILNSKKSNFGTIFKYIILELASKKVIDIRVKTGRYHKNDPLLREFIVISSNKNNRQVLNYFESYIISKMKEGDEYYLTSYIVKLYLELTSQSKNEFIEFYDVQKYYKKNFVLNFFELYYLSDKGKQMKKELLFLLEDISRFITEQESFDFIVNEIGLKSILINQKQILINNQHQEYLRLYNVLESKSNFFKNIHYVLNNPENNDEGYDL